MVFVLDKSTSAELENKALALLADLKKEVAERGVMELVDVVDSKSTAGDSVPVRVRSPAPKKRHP